ncbi:flagellar brake protein [Caballeronia zhejiangensis]|uniref:flagellar brake protein n=1 Tax=Caballeronia zhejiangensis TaxID=871203 RepID=UPI001F517253|nr:flagellar brake protein [Caballeronia zhejiangensis]
MDVGGRKVELCTPLEIAALLQNLARRGDLLSVTRDEATAVTRLLQVDTARHLMVVEWSSTMAQQYADPMPSSIFVQAKPGGVQLEFRAKVEGILEFEKTTVLQARFPTSLNYLQRRKYFRVATPVVGPYLCTGKLSDDEVFCCEVQNLSLSGLALRSVDKRVALLNAGTILREVELNLGHLSTITVNLEFVSHRPAVRIDEEPWYVAGFAFHSLPDAATNTLQRRIAQLEAERLKTMVSRQGLDFGS